jgi:hypothetical protein
MRPRTPLLALLVSALALSAAPLPVSATVQQAAPDSTYIVQLNPSLRGTHSAAETQVAQLGGELVGSTSTPSRATPPA